MSWKEIEKELLERFADDLGEWERKPQAEGHGSGILVTGPKAEGSVAMISPADPGHRISFIDPGHRIRVTVKTGSFSAVALFLAGSSQARFITATAMDTLGAFIEIWYHFDLFQAPQVLSIRVQVPKSNPSVASVTPILPGAERIEREICEMFGVHFEGHPAPGRLLLPEGWPRTVYPMRKD
jgi:NADH-quinone oxidoreductase subunit C